MSQHFSKASKMHKHYSAITIIYNPNSTGPGKKLAKDLQKRLKLTASKGAVSLVATEYAGHAEELAEAAALATSNPLIISASGDGGYNEVINGIMRASGKGAKATTGLLPAGNANDHHRNLHEIEIVDAVADGSAQIIDLLELKGTSKGKPFTRYAHSYIGLGLTPQVGHALNKTKLNPVKEIFVVAKVLLLRKPVHLIIDKRARAYDSVLASNVPTMSKYFSILPDARANDGKFELTIYRQRNKLRILRYAAAASTKGLPGAVQKTSFNFRTVRPTLVQLDGEILKLDGNTEATIRIMPRSLRCII